MNEKLVKTLIKLSALFIPNSVARKMYRNNLTNKYFGYNLINGEKVEAFEKKCEIFKQAPDEMEFTKFENPIVSIVIPVYNQYNYTKLCLYSILKHTDNVSYEVIVADDCSDDETKNIEERIKNIQVVHNEQNLRFLKNCNNAAKYAKGKYILFLNNDTQVQPNWLKPLVDLIESDSKIGMVGSQLLYPDLTLQEAGGIIWQDATGCNYGRNQIPWFDEYSYVKEVDYISGASIMLSNDLWKSLNGFDEEFTPAYYEDTDLAFRIRENGLKVMYQPLSRVVHFEGKSNGTDLTSGQKQYQAVNAEKFKNKWNKVLKENHLMPDEEFFARDRSKGKKVLLFLDWQVLTYDKDTGSRASFQYLEFFLKHGFNVKFLPCKKCIEDYHLTKLYEMGIEPIYSYDNDNYGWVLWLKKYGRYVDYIYVNRPYVADAFLYGLRKYTNAKIIFQGHDLHYLRMYRGYELTKDKNDLFEAKKMEKMEKSVIPKMDVITYFSEVEVEKVKDFLPKNKIIDTVPLYVFDTKEKENIEYNPELRKDIMFIGGYKHLPNKDAAIWIAKEIMPLVTKQNPDIKLHLVGSPVLDEIKELESENVCVHGFMTDEDLDKLYKEIKIAVVPLRFGAGVKGKVLESLYNKVPVITTSIGAEGIPSKEEMFVIKDEPDEFANAILNLYNDDERLVDLSKKSLPFLDKYYSDNAVLEKFKQWIDIK